MSPDALLLGIILHSYFLPAAGHATSWSQIFPAPILASWKFGLLRHKSASLLLCRLRAIFLLTASQEEEFLTVFFWRICGLESV
jgi:hypothetical protein